jgi:hypothetical protein
MGEQVFTELANKALVSLGYQSTRSVETLDISWLGPIPVWVRSSQPGIEARVRNDSDPGSSVA